MSLPRVAQLRQQAALNRRRTLEENAMSAHADDRNSMFGKHQQNSRYAPKFSASLNRQVRQRERMITAKEWEESVASYEDSGRKFRVMFYGFIVGSLLLLALLKYDVEANLEVPQIESGAGFGEIKGDVDGEMESGSIPTSRGAAGVQRLSEKELNSLYEILGVNGEALQRKVSEEARSSANEGNNNDGVDGAAVTVGSHQKPADRDKERRRENYRVRQELKRAYDAHQEGYGQLVSCGRACEAKHQQVEIAYRTLSSQVERELYGVLLNAKDTKSKRASSPTELREAYAKKKAEIESTEEGDDKQMALEELHDAYEILSNPDARTYYHMYGVKPPEMIKHVSNRHGGWGQELELGTYKHRLIFAWIDYFDSTWAIDAVLGAIAIFVLMRLPQAIKQSQKLVEDMEWEEAMQAKEKGRTASPSASAE